MHSDTVKQSIARPNRNNQYHPEISHRIHQKIPVQCQGFSFQAGKFYHQTHFDL